MSEFDIDPRIVEYLVDHIDYEDGEALMPVHVVVAAEYIDADGEARWSSHSAGNSRVSGTIGLLEFAKDKLISEMKEWS